MEKEGFVYILASRGKRIYVGVTSQLMIRVEEHKSRANPHSYSARYNIDQLVYFERFGSIAAAINREAQIKNMHRLQKIQMIVSVNPTWRDLSLDWGRPAEPFDEAEMRKAERFGG